MEQVDILLQGLCEGTFLRLMHYDETEVILGGNIPLVIAADVCDKKSSCHVFYGIFPQIDFATSLEGDGVWHGPLPLTVTYP